MKRLPFYRLGYGIRILYPLLYRSLKDYFAGKPLPATLVFVVEWGEQFVGIRYRQVVQ